jgi:hypothetical protein
MRDLQLQGGRGGSCETCSCMAVFASRKAFDDDEGWVGPSRDSRASRFRKLGSMCGPLKERP